MFKITRDLFRAGPETRVGVDGEWGMNEWRKGDGLLMSTSADMMFQTLADTRTTLTHDSRGPTRWEKQTKEKKNG